jgi:hypothetical protein
LNHYIGLQAGPIIVEPCGYLPVGSKEYTFVMICGPSFDQRIPNASMMSRLGWCHGFEDIGIPYQLVSIFDIELILPMLPNPICWISGDDYQYLKKTGISSLSKYMHFVLVSTSFQNQNKFFQENNFPNQSWDNNIRACIDKSNPAFLFTFAPESSFEFYAEWIGRGHQLISLPLACDRRLYNTSAQSFIKEKNIKLAFVGGYWSYKARQLDEYLKPFASSLTVYGYSSWPYGSYGGRLDLKQEASLYASANLCPIINEPHVSAMNIDMNERVFKVLGAGGMAVTDATQGYRQWFNKNELLIPKDLNEFHEIVHEILLKPEAYAKYKKYGQNAVLDRHTYSHRAIKVIKLLGEKIFAKISASLIKPNLNKAAIEGSPGI